MEQKEKSNFKIFIRELGGITALENEEIIEILSNLSTHLTEYKKKFAKLEDGE